MALVAKGLNSIIVGTACDTFFFCLQSRFGPAALKPSNGKNFMSMQSLCSSGGHKLSKSNGSLNTLGSLNSPPRRGPLKSTNNHSVSHHESESEENDSLSDCRQNSVNSFSGYSSGFSVARGQISASTGHINHIGGSLDRASRTGRDMAPGEKIPLSCKSMATLSRLQCSGEPPPPYEYSQSVEDVARQLEEKLHEKGVELRQLRRNPSDKDDPFTQVSGCALWTLCRKHSTQSLKRPSHQSNLKMKDKSTQKLSTLNAYLQYFSFYIN